MAAPRAASRSTPQPLEAGAGIAVAPLHAGDDPVRRPHTDVMAPDMGTNEQVMAWFMDTYSMYQGQTVTEIVTGKPVAVGGTAGAAGSHRPRRRPSRPAGDERARPSTAAAPPRWCRGSAMLARYTALELAPARPQGDRRSPTTPARCYDAQGPRCSGADAHTPASTACSPASPTSWLSIPPES